MYWPRCCSWYSIRARLPFAPQSRLADLLAKGRVLVAVLVDDHEAGIAALGLDGAHVAKGDLGLHSALHLVDGFSIGSRPCPPSSVPAELDLDLGELGVAAPVEEVRIVLERSASAGSQSETQPSTRIPCERPSTRTSSLARSSAVEMKMQPSSSATPIQDAAVRCAASGRRSATVSMPLWRLVIASAEPGSSAASRLGLRRPDDERGRRSLRTHSIRRAGEPGRRRRAAGRAAGGVVGVEELVDGVEQDRERRRRAADRAQRVAGAVSHRRARRAAAAPARRPPRPAGRRRRIGASRAVVGAGAARVPVPAVIERRGARRARSGPRGRRAAARWAVSGSASPAASAASPASAIETPIPVCRAGSARSRAPRTTTRCRAETAAPCRRGC